MNSHKAYLRFWGFGEHWSRLTGSGRAGGGLVEAPPTGNDASSFVIPGNP
jgi:hypothetical protein